MTDGFKVMKADGTRPQGYPVKVELLLLPTKCAQAVAFVFGRVLPALTKHTAYKNGEKLASTYRRVFR